MSTGEILRKYRESIMDKEYCSDLLSYIYLTGGCEENDIKRDLKLSLPLIIETLKLLFIEGFVKQSGVKMKVTPKSIALLEELGMGEVTSNFLIQEEVNDELDAAFFEAFNTAYVKKDTDIPLTITILNLKKAFSFHQDKIDSKEKSDILWTMLVGHNELLSKTSPEYFVQTIFKTHSESNSKTWQKYHHLLQDHGTYYAKRCRSGLENYDLSNWYLMDNSKKKSNEVIRTILTTRLIILLEDQFLDNDLNYFKDIDKEVLSRNIHLLQHENEVISSYLKAKIKELQKQQSDKSISNYSELGELTNDYQHPQVIWHYFQNQAFKSIDFIIKFFK